MRAWKLTAALAFAALVAAGIAPTLFPSKQACKAPSVGHAASPAVPASIGIPEAVETQAAPVPRGVLAELVKQPEPKPDEVFWDDCPACGMG